MHSKQLKMNSLHMNINIEKKNSSMYKVINLRSKNFFYPHFKRVREREKKITIFTELVDGNNSTKTCSKHLRAVFFFARLHNKAVLSFIFYSVSFFKYWIIINTSSYFGPSITFTRFNSFPFFDANFRHWNNALNSNNKKCLLNCSFWAEKSKVFNLFRKIRCWILH